MSNKGDLYVIAAPSGTGKTTLVKALVDSITNITVSISHTTRCARENEVDGVNYYFLDKDAFKKKIEEHDFLEYAIIFDHFYGTSKSWVNETLNQGIDVILEIDWQGNQQIKEIYPDAISIFILPPSKECVKDRLIKRNQDHLDIINKRLEDIKETISHINEFDYVALNDNFEHAVADLKTIVLSNRLKCKRQMHKYQQLLNEFYAIKDI